MDLEKYSIVYSLQVTEGLGIILPSAHICIKDGYDIPTYPKATALIDTVGSYGILIEDTPHGALLDLCRELSIPQLENYFNRNKKKFEPLTGLFSNPQIQKSISDFIDRRMHKFFTLVRDNGCKLAFNLQRKVRFGDVEIFFTDNQLRPEMKFTRTQTGIKYELALMMQDEKIGISTNNIVILSNSPGYILIKNHVFQIENVNASKIKPFLTKEYVFIPEKMVKQYFDQFIVDMLAKVDVVAEGFTIERRNEILQRKIVWVYDLFKDKWQIELQFQYDGFVFNGSDAGKRKTKITFGEESEIIVTECVRQTELETEAYAFLQSLGFTREANNRFEYGEGRFAVFEMAGIHYERLSTHFNIESLQWDEKKIVLSKVEIKPDFSLHNDWFDLKGSISINNVYYPISLFFENIRNQNPYFRLENGDFILLPAEIMAKYESIIKFSKNDGRDWRLPKMHFNLLNKEHENDIVSVDLETGVNAAQYIRSKQLNAELRPYQYEGISWLVQHRINNLGACLADDMGLGKTLQTIAALIDAKENLGFDNSDAFAGRQLDLFEQELANKKNSALRALIVLPASLVFNWYSEVKKYAPTLHVVRYTGGDRKKLQQTLLSFDIILTTYQTVVSDINWMQNLHFHYVVLDESQQIRNKDSKIFQSVLKLQTNHKLSLSGTPIENSLSDLWSQMEFINPTILGSYAFFKKNYQVPIEKNRDQQAIEELKILVSPFVLRRTKEQVAKDLPDLVEQIYFSDMETEQKKLYEEQKSAVRNLLLDLHQQKSKSKLQILTSLMKLRQISNHPILVDAEFSGLSGKFEDIKNNIKTVVLSGHKLLVFSSFLGPLDLIGNWLANENIPFVALKGDMPALDRENAVNRFQNDAEVKVFLLSIKAGGTGLNLTEADYVFILDPWWNPFVEKQAIARAHRIGRTKNVMVVRFISKDTIEEKILILQEKKKQLSDDIIEVEDMPDLDTSDLDILLS